VHQQLRLDYLARFATQLDNSTDPAHAVARYWTIAELASGPSRPVRRIVRGPSRETSQS